MSILLVETRLGVCANGHVPFIMLIIVKKNDDKNILFFKTKNCSNDNPFISCNDKIGKMLHDITYLLWRFPSGERAAARTPLVFLARAFSRQNYQSRTFC